LSACGSKSANETSGGNKSKKEPIKIGFSALPSWTLFKIREDIPKKWYFTGVSAAKSYLDSIHKILKYCI